MSVADCVPVSVPVHWNVPAPDVTVPVLGVPGVAEKFDGYPLGVRAVQVPDPGTASYFLRTFGRSERVTACACERLGEVSLPQVLHLIGGDVTTGKVGNGSGWLAKTLKAEKDDDKVTAELFVRTLAREPTAAERAKVRELLADAPRDELFRDLFWALLNSKDFLFNH